MDVFDLVAKIRLDDSEYESGVKNAKGTFSTLASGLKTGLATVAKVGSAAVAAAATGVAALTKMSIESYAEYEQLVGGVETLFKDSSGTILAYAENAYKTAGLSANQYMEMATSFSASLLQSLEGDTAAAAEYANLAMTDMSDNANKMGTSIESLQYAYNGFAKGNFTMLDNLKLGYGGTKDEMDRLCYDAAKLAKEMGFQSSLISENESYDMNNLAHVMEAIHIIQMNLGITGTTVLEASTTISGSVTAMKASWQNLLTAISADDLPFEEYITNFVDSVSIVAENLLPRIQIALEGVVQLIDQLAPVIIAAIPELFSTLLPPVISAATELLNSIVAVLPDLVNMLVTSVIPQLITGIVDVFNALVIALPGLIETIIAALPTLIPQLVNGLVSMIVTLCTMLPQIIQPIIDYLPDILISVVDALMNNLPILIECCVALIVGIIQAVPQIIVPLVQALPEILGMVVDGLMEAAPVLWDGIIQICTTYWEELKAYYAALFATVGEWLSPITETVSTFFADLWEVISTWFSNAVEWINTNVVQPVLNFFQSLWDGIKVVWDGICNVVSIAVKLIASILDAAFQIITLPFRFIWENCKEYVFAAWEWIKDVVSTAVNAVSEVISTAFNAVKDFFVTIWNEIKEVFTTAWDAIVDFLTPGLNAIKDFFVTIWTAIKDVVSTAVNAVKNTVTTAFDAVKTNVSTVWNSIKTTITGVWDNIKSGVTSAVDSVKTKVSNAFDSVKTKATTVWNSIKSAITGPIEEAKNTVKSVVDKIKEFFNFSVELPHIKLPHFSIKPSGWQIGDLLEGSIPSLGIEWYAKAMNNPMIMTRPTIFGYNAATGELLAGGEAGSEVVSGTDTLLNMIGSVVDNKVSAQMQGMNTLLAAILEAIVTGNSDMIHALLSGHTIKIGEREFARLVREYA